MRVDIFDALKAMLSSVPGVVKFSDRPKHHDQIKSTDMPTIFLLPFDEDHSRRTGGETIPILRPTVVVFTAEDEGADKSAGRVLIEVLDALDTKLKGSPLTDGRQTLGGLVHDCFVSGTVETDGGEWGSKAGAVLPLEIHIYG